MIGRIAKVCKENLLVIDPEVFADNADFSGRSEFASGLWRSMIGGEFAVKDDALTSAARGEFLHVGTGSGIRTRCDAERAFRFKGGDR